MPCAHMTSLRKSVKETVSGYIFAVGISTGMMSKLESILGVGKFWMGAGGQI